MPRDYQRAELIRKVKEDTKRRMRRRNRRVVIFAFCLALVVGLALGIWVAQAGWAPSLPTFKRTDAQPLAPEDWTISPDIFSDSKNIDVTPTPEISQAPAQPTQGPTEQPTEAPEPTEAPTELPEETQAPTDKPTETPTPEPTEEATPTPEPTKASEETPKQVFTVYKKGDRNDEIKKIQELLIEGGYLDDKADGIFGNNTEAALIAYQKAQGLEENGIADEATQEKLFGITVAPQVELMKPQTTQEPVKSISIAMGERQEVADLCTFTIDRFDFNYTVQPSNAKEGTIYSFYESSNNEMTYLYLTGKITNTSQKAIMPNVMTFSAYTGSLQEYSGFTAFEMDGGENLKAYATLEPGQTTALVLLVEVPVALSQSDEPIVGTIAVGNTICQMTLR